MASIQNSAETLNAAATAIVRAETRVQPSAVQKRRWGSWRNLYWCFGSYKHNKRIGDAVLVPEPTAAAAAASSSETSNQTTSLVLPFVAPPSSPVSFLQSDPPSATQSPARKLSLKSLSVNAYSAGGPAAIFTIGPYAYETQLVSPPVFSAGTTEPSTAAYTPPPESVQPTAPSSPDVPFAQLLASSLARKGRNNKTNLRFSLSQYEFQPYQDPGSPGGRLRSPGSAVSVSGTSSPYPDKHPDHFTTRKWASRLGSGSLTPNGWGSRLGSGTLTPNGGLSRLGSGTLTPDGGEPVSQDIYLLENKNSNVESLANSDNASQHRETIIDPRVSFELSNDVQYLCRGELSTSRTTKSESPQTPPEGTSHEDVITKESNISCEYCSSETMNRNPGKVLDGEPGRCFHKQQTITLVSGKDFNFGNTEKGGLDKSIVECEWWKNEKFPGNNKGSDNGWTFFPMLQPGVS